MPEREPENELPDDESPAGLRITQGIADALLAGRPIDDETAMLIARAMSPGSGGFQKLADTGEVVDDIALDFAVAAEILGDFDQDRVRLVALAGYCVYREDTGPVQGWPGGDKGLPRGGPLTKEGETT